MLKNTYNFKSNYFKFISVDLYHNYYQNNLIQGIVFSADEETNQILRSHNIIFRQTDSGFVLIRKIESRFKSISFKGIINLKFFFSFRNKYFVNITNLPYSNNQKLVFNNTQDINDEKLHKSEYVDENNIQKSDEEGLFGEINLRINSKNQFFGSDLIHESQNELSYSIYFKSRKVKFRYNFYSSSDNIDIENYYLTDDQNSFKLKNFGKRTLSNGKLVFFVELNDQIVLSENYNRKYYLKKEEDFLTYYSLFLPYPKNNTISYDSARNNFFNDVFIKI